MRRRNINLAISILFVFSIFLLSYLYRQNRDNDIQKHSLYTIGKVVKFSKTLKSGDYWDYEFEYNGLYFKGSKPTHVDYDVKIGDQFLINFSSENPSNNKILYQFKINPNSLKKTDIIWKTIPYNILHSGEKSE